MPVWQQMQYLKLGRWKIVLAFLLPNIRDARKIN